MSCSSATPAPPHAPCPFAVESEHQAAAATRQYDVTAAVIQQLEASLSSSPTQRQQQQRQDGGQ